MTTFTNLFLKLTHLNLCAILPCFMPWCLFPVISPFCIHFACLIFVLLIFFISNFLVITFNKFWNSPEKVQIKYMNMLNWNPKHGPIKDDRHLHLPPETGHREKEKMADTYTDLLKQDTGKTKRWQTPTLTSWNRTQGKRKDGRHLHWTPEIGHRIWGTRH